jgi:hypothetical protein
MPGTEPVQFSSVHLRAVGSSMVRWQRRSGRKARWCVAYVSAAPRNEAQGGRAPQQLCIRRRRLDVLDDGAAKAYVHSLGEALHYEFKPLGVYVTVLAAGFTNTPVLEKFGFDPKTIPMKPMSGEQCVSEDLSERAANGANHGTSNRLNTGGAEGAGDAQDPSRTIAASERALNGAIVKNEARLKGEAPRERYIEDWEVVEVLSLPSVRKRGSVLAIQHYIRLKRLTGLRRSDLLRLQVSPCCEDGTSGQTRSARRSEAWRNSRSGARLLVVRPRFSLQQRKSSSTKGKVPSGHEQHQNPRSTD